MPVKYPHRAVIIAPAATSALNASIAQAIGPSSRDDLSFASITATKAGVTYQVCDVAITAETRAQYAAMLTNPTLLHGAVVAGWERKDIDPPPPDAATVAAWLASATVWLGDAWAITGGSIDDVLAGLGFARVVPPALPLGQP